MGCISLVKSKNGLLRDITRILFCQRHKESEKRLIADSFLRKKRKIQKRIFPGNDISAETACHTYFFESIPKETQKRQILRIRIQINPLNPRRERIHWIHNPFLDFTKETKNPFLDWESGLGFSPKKCTHGQRKYGGRLIFNIFFKL